MMIVHILSDSDSVFVLIELPSQQLVKRRCQRCLLKLRSDYATRA